jgi:hypothetical protein
MLTAAQRRIRKPSVVGSNPTFGSISKHEFGAVQATERLPAYPNRTLIPVAVRALAHRGFVLGQQPAAQKCPVWQRLWSVLPRSLGTQRSAQPAPSLWTPASDR